MSLPYLRQSFLALFAIVLIGCTPVPEYETSSEWVIHNPADVPIGVEIDGKAMRVEPNQSLPITLEAGKHTIDSAITGPLEFMVYVNAKGGLINPTLNPYIIHSISFTRDGSDGTFDARGDRTQVISLDDMQFKGAFQLHDGLFIDKDWAYAIGEAVPDEITSDSTLPGGYLNKLYSKAEFLAKAQITPQPFEPNMEWQPPALPLVPAFESQALEAVAAPYREAQRGLYLSTDPETQAVSRATMTELAGAVQDLYRKDGTTWTAKDDAAYEVFAQSLFFKGAMVLPKAQ